MHLFYDPGPQPVLVKAPTGSVQDLMLCWGRAKASARRLPVLLYMEQLGTHGREAK